MLQARGHAGEGTGLCGKDDPPVLLDFINQLVGWPQIQRVHNRLGDRGLVLAGKGGLGYARNLDQFLCEVNTETWTEPLEYGANSIACSSDGRD